MITTRTPGTPQRPRVTPRTRQTPQGPRVAPIYAIDFGTGNALAIHGPEGPVSKRALKLPRVVGGKTPRDEFRLVVEALFALGGDVVIESPTIGSSGCEQDDVLELLARWPERALYTVTARAVKNLRLDIGLPFLKAHRKYEVDAPLDQDTVHAEDAELIYRLAVEYPHRLYKYRPSDEIVRLHRSVRPMDKRGYRDERAESYMEKLPPFSSLPEVLRTTLGTQKGEYSRSMVMPFAMATDEPFIDSGPREQRRRRYEKVIGLYDRGYPSFYRRATIAWMIAVLKQQTGIAKKSEATPAQRKEAWRETQRQIRHFFHLTMAHQGR